MTHLVMNRFSVNEKTFTTKWLKFWKTTPLVEKLPFLSVLLSLSFITERLSYYRLTFLTKSNEQMPYMKLIMVCYGFIETVGASLPVIFSSKLSAITILSAKQNSTLWLQTKLWIIIAAVVFFTLNQLSLCNKNDAAMIDKYYTSWALFIVAWHFFACAFLSLFRVYGMKKLFVDKESPQRFSDAFNIIKRMERQVLMFIVSGSVLTLHVFFNMTLKPGAVFKLVYFCELTNMVFADIIIIIAALLLYLYLYLHWPRTVGFIRNRKDKKVAPERKKKDSVSSIGSEQHEGSNEKKNTEKPIAELN